jgi:predicted ATPase
MLQIGSAFSLRATKGFTAPEVERVLVRARELCSDANDSAQLFNVLVGMHTFYMYRRLETSRELAQQLLSLAESLEEPAKIATAYLALGETSMYLGEFHAAQSCLERTTALGSGHRADELNAAGYSAVTLWSLGWPEQAATRMRAVLAVAQEQNRPLLTANVLAYASTVYAQTRLWEASRQQAEAGIALSNQHGFLFHTHWFEVVHGRALIGEGGNEQGIAVMHRGIAGLDALGAVFSFVLGYFAEGCLNTALVEEGLEAISRAVRIGEEKGERWQLADLHRLRGQLLLMRDPSKTAEAERSFRIAMDIAREQDAKSFALRAATSLARLQAEQGYRGDARTLLAGTYEWFMEGFDTADLREAKALLDELSR